MRYVSSGLRISGNLQLTHWHSPLTLVYPDPSLGVWDHVNYSKCFLSSSFSLKHSKEFCLTCVHIFSCVMPCLVYFPTGTSLLLCKWMFQMLNFPFYSYIYFSFLVSDFCRKSWRVWQILTWWLISSFVRMQYLPSALEEGFVVSAGETTMLPLSISRAMMKTPECTCLHFYLLQTVHQN